MEASSSLCTYSNSDFELWNKLGGFNVLLSFLHPDVQPEEECALDFALFSTYGDNICCISNVRDNES